MGKTSFAHPVKTMAKPGQNWLPGKTSFDRPVKTTVLTGQNWPVGKICQPCVQGSAKLSCQPINTKLAGLHVLMKEYKTYISDFPYS